MYMYTFIYVKGCRAAKGAGGWRKYDWIKQSPSYFLSWVTKTQPSFSCNILSCFAEKSVTIASKTLDEWGRLRQTTVEMLYCPDMVVTVLEGMSQVWKRLDICNVNGALSTPGYLLALLRNLYMFRWPLQKLFSRCRYEKRTEHAVWTRFEEEMSEIRPWYFEPRISFILFYSLLPASWGGVGFSRTNADSQWNPVYNTFHRFFCVWKWNDPSVVLQTSSWRGKPVASVRAWLLKANAEL